MRMLLLQAPRGCQVLEQHPGGVRSTSGCREGGKRADAALRWRPVGEGGKNTVPGSRIGQGTIRQRRDLPHRTLLVLCRASRWWSPVG